MPALDALKEAIQRYAAEHAPGGAQEVTLTFRDDRGVVVGFVVVRGDAVGAMDGSKVRRSLAAG